MKQMASVALVTGAARGIGRAIAIFLAFILTISPWGKRLPGPSRR